MTDLVCCLFFSNVVVATCFGADDAFGMIDKPTSVADDGIAKPAAPIRAYSLAHTRDRFEIEDEERRINGTIPTYEFNCTFHFLQGCSNVFVI